MDIVQNDITARVPRFEVVISGKTQYMMHHRLVFGEVDVQSASKFVHTLRESHFVSKVEEEFHRLSCDMLSRVVQYDASLFDSVPPRDRLTDIRPRVCPTKKERYIFRNSTSLWFRGRLFIWTILECSGCIVHSN